MCEHDRICNMIEVEKASGRLYAVHTSEGIAIYSDLFAAVDDILENSVETNDDMHRYYHAHKWKQLSVSEYRRMLEGI